MVWSQINWKQDRPEMKDVEKALKRLVINEVIIEDPVILEYIKLFKNVSNVGDIVFKCFNVQCDPNIDWFAERNRFNEINYFKSFFNHSNVLKSMPTMLSENYINNKTFINYHLDQLCLDGFLTKIILEHPYDKYEGNMRAVKELADKVCYAMFQYRYEDILVYFKNADDKRIIDMPPYEEYRWSPWFFDLIWDNSYFVIDKKAMNIWIILSTDND